MKSLRVLMRGVSRWFDAFEPYYGRLAMVVAFALASSITYSAWNFAHEAEVSEAQIRFEFRANRMADAIRGRMVDYEQVLRGGVGLFAASESVERREWQAYIEHLRIEAIYPGIQGIGFVPRVPAGQKARHEHSVREAGYPGYSIQPAGDRQEYAPVAYIEPFNGRNLRAFGFDMLSEPERRATIERARDLGEPAVTGRVRLLQETDRDVQAGVIMFVPVYRGSMDTATVFQRRAALSGYVYSPFRMDDLMRGILGKLDDVRLRIFDGEPGEDRLLYDSQSNGAARHHAATFSLLTQLPMRGRTWTLQTTSLPAFERAVDRRTPALVAAATAAISLLTVAIMYMLVTLRMRAVRLARGMTRELRESREQLALALQGSNLALFDWDIATGQVRLSEIWGVVLGGGPQATATTIGELEKLVHPEDLPVLKQQLYDVLRGNSQSYRVEHRVQVHGGSWKWIASNAKVVERDAAGRAVRVAGTNADISDRKEIERLKNEFVATVSHELRTPLTAVVGALGLLKEQAGGALAPDAAVFLEMARKNSDRLAALINDILDIEKIESGRMEFRAEPVEMRSFLEHAIDMNRMYAERYGVAFRLEEPVPAASVMADRDRMLQALTNLLSNAAKYSPHGQIVSISVIEGVEAARVSVTDRGAGIPESFRGRIFQKFAQADGSDTRGKGGTGLGLSISKAIIEKMGGRIDYESTPGKGSTFHFELPLAKVEGRKSKSES